MRAFFGEPDKSLRKSGNSNLAYKITDKYVEVEAAASESIYLVLYYFVNSDGTATVVAALPFNFDIIDSLNSFEELEALAEVCPTIVGLLLNCYVQDPLLPMLIHDNDPDDNKKKSFVVFSIPDKKYDSVNESNVDEFLWDVNIQAGSKLVISYSIKTLGDADEKNFSIWKAASIGIRKGIKEGLKIGVKKGLKEAFGQIFDSFDNNFDSQAWDVSTSFDEIQTSLVKPRLFQYFERHR